MLILIQLWPVQHSLFMSLKKKKKGEADIYFMFFLDLATYMIIMIFAYSKCAVFYCIMFLCLYFAPHFFLTQLLVHQSTALLSAAFWCNLVGTGLMITFFWEATRGTPVKNWPKCKKQTKPKLLDEYRLPYQRSKVPYLYIVFICLNK